jgi:hypothetical protein
MRHLLPTSRRRRAARRVSALVIVASWLAVAAIAAPDSMQARAQPAQTNPEGSGGPAVGLPERLSGRWELAITQPQAEQVVHRAAAQATSGMLPLVSGMTARELRSRNPVNGAFTLQVTPARVVAEFETSRFDSAPSRPVQTTVPGERDSMELVQVLRGGRLEQIFTTDRGRRWSMFTPSADGSQLTLEVVVTSNILPREMRYELPYRRAEGTATTREAR